MQAIAFPLCRATDSLWNTKVVSLLSSVMTVVRLPISCTSSSMACWLYDPAVSMATGKNMCVFSSPWYFAVLLSAACLDASPCLAALELRWNSVELLTINYPLSQGIKVLLLLLLLFII